MDMPKIFSMMSIIVSSPPTSEVFSPRGQPAFPLLSVAGWCPRCLSFPPVGREPGLRPIGWLERCPNGGGAHVSCHMLFALCDDMGIYVTMLRCHLHCVVRCTNGANSKYLQQIDHIRNLNVAYIPDPFIPFSKRCRP